MPFAPHDEGFEPSTLPEFNMYHPEHQFQKMTDKHDQSGRPCSWLYGIFVLNPNGKVSPCCASAGEETDFGDYSIKGGFFNVWNNSTFKQARAMFTTTSQPSAPQPVAVEAQSNLVQIERKDPARVSKEDDSDLIAGMGSNLSKSLNQGELICNKCPIPWRQDDVDSVISKEVARLMRSFWETKSLKNRARVATAYLLMGAPGWTDIARAKLHKTRATLSLAFDRR